MRRFVSSGDSAASPAALQMQGVVDVEAAVAEAAQQLDEQEWNMNELERIQEEQVGLGTSDLTTAWALCPACLRASSNGGFTDELRASRRSRRCLAAARHPLLSVHSPVRCIPLPGRSSPADHCHWPADRVKGRRLFMQAQLAICQAPVTAHSLVSTQITMPTP